FPIENVIGLTTNGKDVFAAAEDGRIIALSAAGEKLWQTDLGGDGASDIEIAGEYVIVTRRATAKWLLQRSGLPVNAPPRSERSDPDLPRLPAGMPKDATASVTRSDGVIVGTESGLVSSLAGSGPVWKFKTGGAISAILAVDDEFVVMSRDNF